MADVTDVLAISFPEGGDSFSTAIVQSMAERIDEVPGIESLTGAEIAALGAALKPAGRVVFNSTTSKLQVSNGTSFVDIDAAALLRANNLSDLASATTARTNLGLGTAATTAATAYATAAQGTKADAALARAGGTMTGYIYGLQPGNDVAMGGNKITGLAAASANGDAVRFEQPLMKTGGTMSGAIAMGSQKITGLAKGTAPGDAIARQQIQSGFHTSVGLSGTVNFSTPFGAQPTVTITPVGNSGTGMYWVVEVTTTYFTYRVVSGGGAPDYLAWIAVGN